MKSHRWLMLVVAVSMLAALIVPSAFAASPNTQVSNAPGYTTPRQDTEMVDTTKYKKDGPYKIGFSNISVVNSWRVQMVEELKYEASLHPEISDLYITDAGGSVDKQIADIEDLMAKGIDALLVTPVSPTALIPTIEEVYKSGIPVIVFNSALDGDQYTSFVGKDQVDFGYVGGKKLVEALGGKGNIIAISGIAGNSIAEDRWKGAQKAFEGTDIKVLGREFGDWALDKGKIAAENLLAAHPQIDGVWSDGGAMTQGAIEAFLAAKRPLVPMTGEDNNGFLKLWLKYRDQGLSSVAPSEPTWVSAEALKQALKCFAGEPVAKKAWLQGAPITDETLIDYVQPLKPDSLWANTHLPPAKIDELYPNEEKAELPQGWIKTDQYKKDGPYKIGFSNISVVNSWRVQMVEELKYAASQHPEISDLYITDAGGSVDKQIADIEDLMAKGIDALLVTPVSPTALIPTIEEVYKSGIPVIVFNSALDGDQYTMFVGKDQVEFGYVGAKKLVEYLGGKGNIIAISGIAGNSIAEDRWKGAQKAFEGTDIKVLGREFGDWALDKGKIAAENLLAAHPQIDGVWSDGGAMTQGAIEAFLAAKRPLVPMTGEDNNGFLKLWAKYNDQGLKSVAPSEPTWVSAQALTFALKCLNGQPVPTKYWLQGAPITDETLAQYVQPKSSGQPVVQHPAAEGSPGSAVPGAAVGPIPASAKVSVKPARLADTDESLERSWLSGMGGGRLPSPLKETANMNGTTGRLRMSNEQGEVILEMRSITKKFPGVVALNGVSFSCRRGCVQALVGENGAGKSTLMKIMSGAYQPDAGKIVIHGEPRTISHPVEAQRLGISIIYQEFNLVPYLSVAENIFMGREPHTPLGLLDRRAMRRNAAEILKQLNLNIDVDAWVRELPVAQQQMVEIAKALSVDAEIIVMDEPTAALADAEVNILFEIVQRLKSMGRSVVFISHRLKEVFQIADTITVMRDGEVTAVKSAAETDVRDVTNLMVGRELSQYFPERHPETKIGKEVLTIRNLSKKGVLDDINLTLHEGEIVGVAGLEGHGQRELARAMFGAEETDHGDVLIEGVSRAISSPREAIEAGIAFVSDDRKTEGVVLDLSVLHNVALPSLERRSSAGFVNQRAEAQAVEDIVQRINVKTPTLRQLVVNLSGGNQQKVVLAKWLMTHPKVMIFSEPTRGIDVGAKEEIYRLMRSFADRGAAILMVSSELGEILGMSDRVLVMHEGRIVAELAGDQATETEIMHAAVTGHQ